MLEVKADALDGVFDAILHNEKIAALEADVAGLRGQMAAPPAGPVVGQCWIVGAGASGAWAGHAGEIAGWTAGGWRFVAPVAGMRVWVRDRGHAMLWNGSAWQNDAVRSDGYYQGGVRVVGARGAAIASPSGGAVIDGEARAAIAAMLSMLRQHGMIAEA